MIVLVRHKNIAKTWLYALREMKKTLKKWCMSLVHIVRGALTSTESKWKYSYGILLKKKFYFFLTRLHVRSSPSAKCLKRNMNMEYVQDVSVPYLQNKLADCIWLVLGNQNKYVPLKFHLFYINEQIE